MLIASQVHACLDREESAEALLGNLLHFRDDDQSAGWRLTMLMAQVTEIQQETKTIRALSIDDPYSIAYLTLDKAQDIDRRLITWALELPQSFRYDLVDAATYCRPGFALGEKVHIYKTLWISKLWNAYRTTRIKLFMCIFDILHWIGLHADEDLAREEHDTQRVIREMISDICASLPFVLGNQTAIDPAPIAFFPKSMIPEANALHSLSMGWFISLVPLNICRKCIHITPEQKIWVDWQYARISIIGSRYWGSSDASTLMSGNLPTFAYTMPINTEDSLSAASLSSPVEHDASIASSDSGIFPISHSLPSAPLVSRPEKTNLPVQGPYGSVPLPKMEKPKTSKTNNSGATLQFINTTRPDQIKDRALQKKIRRDVMLNYLRTSQANKRDAESSNVRTEPSRFNTESVKVVDAQ